MIHINLLPYREEKRKVKRKRFFSMLGMVAILACLIVFAVYTVIDGQVVIQQERNDFLKREIASLDKQIEEIKRLNDQARALLARKQIIESLQQDRAEAVRLLSELTKQMPEGVYIRSLKQSGQRVVLSGYAQSSARVSTLMRNIEASEWLERPILQEIKAVTVEKRRLNEFNLNLVIKRTATQEAAKTNQGAGKR
jgi:type IV pilus assembly protein PilN